MLDVSDLEPPDVLRALYNSARPQGLGFLHYTSELMTRPEAEELLDGEERYFDYLKGRVMKIEIGGKELDERLYDRDNGIGAAAASLERARQ